MGKLSGIRQLRAVREGKHLTYKNACLAKCAECMNEYRDGAADCKVKGCPLYEYMPYAGKGEELAVPEQEEGESEDSIEPEVEGTGEVEI